MKSKRESEIIGLTLTTPMLKLGSLEVIDNDSLMYIIYSHAVDLLPIRTSFDCVSVRESDIFQPKAHFV